MSEDPSRTAPRDFAALAAEQPLERFLGSRWGTLYFVPPGPGRRLMLVRRFDGEWPPGLIGPYVDLLDAAQRWIEARPEIAGLVRVDQPIEVGRDFVARPHRLYHVSLDSYDEGTIEPPKELELLRGRLTQMLEAPASGGERETILRRAIARSVLETTDKTYWKSDERRFVIVEPRLTTELLERWASSGGSS